MAFGFPMRFKHTLNNGKKVYIIMRPYRNDEVDIISEGFSRLEVSRYIGNWRAWTHDQEIEWLNKAAGDENSVVWAICIAKTKKDRFGRPIGTTSISEIRNNRGTSGCTIYDMSLWGNGIASVCHRARCYYAVYVMNLRAIDSYVAFPNHGSRKALQGVGYLITGISLGIFYSGGAWHNAYRLTWINPACLQDFPEVKQLASKRKKASKKATHAIAWSAKNITFL